MSFYLICFEVLPFWLQEQKQSSLRAQSSSFRHLQENSASFYEEALPATSLAEVKNILPFLKEDALTEIIKVCDAPQMINLCC